MIPGIALALACHGSAPEPGTQIGDEGGDSCEERSLTPDDTFAYGAPISDALALVTPAGTLVATWFDARVTPLRLEVVPDLATLRQTAACEVVADAHVSIGSDDGAVVVERDERLLFEINRGSRVDLVVRLDDADWAGALVPSSVHAVPCVEEGGFELSNTFTADGPSGYLWHACRVVPRDDDAPPARDTGPTVTTEGAHETVEIVRW